MGLFSRKRQKPWDDLENFELPHFPATTLQTLEVLRDESSDSSQVARALGQDPGLTVRVLRIVNSSEFGTRTQVDDLAHACQLVGLSALEALVISVAVPEALPQDVPGLNTKRFWSNAQKRGSVARALANELCPSKAALYFTTALLSDMAVPLLSERLGESYIEVVDAWLAGKGELGELEENAFGWNHSEAGAWMAKAWQLPAAMVESIGTHHHEDGPRDPVALAGMIDLRGPDKDAARIAEMAAEEFGADASALEQKILDALGGS